jgi:bacterioferritin
VKVLNEVLATELVCVLRYKRHYFMAAGIDAEAVKAEFLQHANEEQQHADWVATRITQLNGEPNLNPEGLAARSHSEYQEGASPVEMIKISTPSASRSNRILRSCDGSATTIRLRES